MTKYKATKDPDIKLDERTGIYYYKGTPVRRGRQIERSLGVRSYNAAVSAKKDFLMKIKGFDFTQRDITFADYAKNVFLPDRKNKAKSTYDAAVAAVKCMMPFFEFYTMRQINDVAWAEYKKLQSQQKPDRQLVNDRKQLIMMLKQLLKKKHIDVLPDLEIPEYELAPKRIFTKQEVDRLIELAHENFKGLIIMLYKMGFRPGEVLNLTWDRVDFEKNIIILKSKDTKTRKGRVLVMNKDVRAWLEKQERKSKFVFQSTKASGREMPMNSTRKIWNKLVKQARLPEPNNMYCLRHTFLTEGSKKLKEGKISLVELCNFAGTSVRMLEEHYLHIDGSDTKDIAEIMDD